MSKLIRNAEIRGPVYIGEPQHDPQAELAAEQRLTALFPDISLFAEPGGVKLIPLTQVEKLEQVLALAKKDAYERGLAEGREQGLETGRAEAREVLAQFDRAIGDAIQQREALLTEAREQILRLVTQISRKVTFDAVAADPEVTMPMIEGVVNTLTDRSRLKVKVNPEHLPVVQRGLDRFLKDSAAVKEIAIEADPRVRYGGCLIETPAGDVDARLESQFDIIGEALGANGEHP